MPSESKPLNKPLTLTHVWAAVGVIVVVGVLIVDVIHIPNPIVWDTALIIVAGGASALISVRYPRTARLKRFKGRELLNDDQIYEQFYRAAIAPRGVVLHEWHHVSRLLEIPAGLLRPTDRFDDELSAVPGWYFYDDGIDILFGEAARRFLMPTDQIMAKIKTLDEYIRLAVEDRPKQNGKNDL